MGSNTFEKIRKRRARAEADREKKNKELQKFKTENVLKGVSTKTINEVRALDGLPPISDQQVQQVQQVMEFSANANFEQMRDEYALKHKCTKIEAHNYVIKNYPDVHRRYIEKHNPHLKDA